VICGRSTRRGSKTEQDEEAMNEESRPGLLSDKLDIHKLGLKLNWFARALSHSEGRKIWPVLFSRLT
jgi:hypothetical protein